jgi:hypothetical protein
MIVISILLAFGVDAWWDGQRDRIEQVRLLQAVQGDLATYERVLDSHAASIMGLVQANGALVHSLSSVPDGEFVTVPAATIRAALEFPSLRIPLNGLDRTGVADAQLRSLIRQWEAEVRATDDHFNRVRDAVHSQVRPLLGAELELSPLDTQINDWFEHGIVPPDDAVRVRKTIALANAISGRGSLLGAASVGLNRLLRLSAQVQERITVELDAS